MPGTLSKYNMPRWAILPALPNGNVPAYTIDSDGLGGIYYADAIRWFWEEENFTVLGGVPLVSSDYDACAQVLDTGNLWDTVPPFSVPGTGTFRDISNGGDWENPDTHDISSGIQGVSAALGYWLTRNTTRVCEQATDAQLWGSITAYLQGIADQQFTGLPTPPQPAPFPPMTAAWPPLAHGVQSGLGLFLAHGSRARGHIDSTGRVILESVPIP